MDISVAMRLGNYLTLIFIVGNLSIIVHQSRNIFLLDDVDTLFPKSKIVEFLK